MPQITLGNITQQNGRNVISGSQSGLDTDSIIKALTEAKRLPAVTLETKNEKLATQKSALTDLQNLLTRFRTAVDTLRNPPGVQNASANIFEYRTANISSVLGASNYLGVTVQPGVAVQNFTVNSITALAKETKQESGTFLLPDLNTAAVKASGTAAAGELQAGSFSLRALDGGADVNITLAEGDTLQNVITKINAVKGQTGMQATAVKVASGSPNNSYKLIFTGTQTGLNGAFDLADSGTVTADPDGVLANLSFNTTQAAQNAQFQLEGVTITRESNVVTDLVDGMTFTLKQPYSDTTPVNVSVEPDLEIATNAINQLADIYNELRVFAAKQNQVGDDGLPLEDAVLSNSSVLRSVLNSVTSVMSSIVDGLADGARGLTDIGIGFQDFAGDDETPMTRNIVVVDAEKLQSALTENYDGVRKIFEFQMSANSPDLAVYQRSQNIAVTSFTLTADVTNGTYTASYSGGTAEFDVSTISGDTKLLTGRAGTPFAGLQLIYASVDDQTIEVTLTQGIADKLYNGLNGILATGGALPNELTQIEDQTTRNEAEITKIDDYIVTYRDQLLDTYSRLEGALTKANQLLSLLDAQAAARENS